MDRIKLIFSSINRGHFGTYFGVPLRIHLSTILVCMILSVFGIFSLSSAVMTFAYITSLLFVVMHEYAHVYAAKKFGIETKLVMVTPIGAAAVIESLNE